MIIAIASGKGGTGKTTVAASLAAVWDRPLAIADLDVEAPNLHLFLHPSFSATTAAKMEVPEIDESSCNRCRACVAICQFKAIGLLGDAILTFPEMCHGCGACMAVCPQEAIRSGCRTLGAIGWGHTPEGPFLNGRLSIGEAMSPPLIRLVRRKIGILAQAENRDVILDAPPGVSCPAVNAVMAADVVVLVTEPTPFGLFDLELALDAFQSHDRRLGVVVNRAGIGNHDVHRLCERRKIPILGEIPYQDAIAEAYARGEIIARVHPEIQSRFIKLGQRLRISNNPSRCAPVREAHHA